MKRLFIGIFALLLSTLHSPPCAAANFSDDEIRVLCDGLIARDVITVRANEALISYKYTQSIDDMTHAMLAQKPIDYRVAGLTSYQSDYTLQLSPAFSPIPIDGKYCYRIGAKLDLAKSPVVVSIAKEVSEQKCTHDVIFEHEMKHVQVYQSFMRYFAQEFKRVFGDELNKVRLTTQKAGVEEEIKRVLAPIMSDYIQKALHRIQTINEEVDSPEEYARIRTACTHGRTPVKN